MYIVNKLHLNKKYISEAIAALILLSIIVFTSNLFGQSFTKITTGDIVNDSGQSCSWGDYNNDGYLDLYISGGNLYHNNGDVTFTKITTGPIFTDKRDSGTWGDYDNDGDLDLFVVDNRGQQNCLYSNNGDGSFTKITSGDVVNEGGRSNAASWGDYNNDGDLDLFVANALDRNNFLYTNKGQGKFIKVTTGVIVNDGGNSESGIWGDHDNDGDLDLFVANGENSSSLNFFYLNNNNNTFNKIPERQIYTGYDTRGASMGDYDNDGDLDIFITNWNEENNVLLANNGDGTFREITTGSIVADNGEFTGSSWGDYDNDGDLDLYVANWDARNNLLFANNGNGTFNKITSILVIEEQLSSWSCSWADIDNDGDLDLFIANSENNSLFVNNGNSNNWINIKCVGTVSNTSAIGAKVRLKANIHETATWQMNEISAQTGARAQNSLNAEFGLGDAAIIDSIKIEWPSGINRFLTNVAVNQFLIVPENRKPELMNTIPDITLTVSGTLFILDLSAPPVVFNDPDGDILSYSATSSNESVATASITGSLLAVTPVAAGMVTITITANDDWRGTNSTTLKVTVVPLSLNLNNVVHFPSLSDASDYRPTDYQIVGLPGASNQSIASFLTGEQVKDWQVYRDNGSESDDPEVYLDEYNGSSKFQFSIGRAFWIIHKGSVNINTEVPFPQLNTSQEAEIPLHYRWNLITNPFTSSISWEAINNANGGNLQPIWKWTSSENNPFIESSNFEPYVGYYFYNDDPGRSSLKVSYSSSVTQSQPSEDLDATSWRVRISLSDSEMSDQSTSFGISKEAQQGLDHLDFRKPRAISVLPGVYFHRPDWGVDYSVFATDIRAEFTDSERWQFDVLLPQKQSAQLSFAGLESVPAQFDVYLIDELTGSTLNLRKDSIYHFKPKDVRSKFSVVVGQTDAVAEELRLVVPQVYILGPNYPNPFNPATTIPVAIPVGSDVKLTIYNILGEEVRILYNGALHAGRHLLTWDGRDAHGNHAGSGVYFYRLTNNANVSLTGKMILMK